MRRLTSSLALVLLAAPSIAAQARQSGATTTPNDSVWTGTRHLVLSKSQVGFTEAAPKAGAILFEPVDSGFKVTITATGPDNADWSFSFAAKFDGKFSPLTGPVAEAGDSASLRRVGARKLASTTKGADGEIRFTATYALSKDGKTVTVNVMHSDDQLAAIYVYEK